MRALALLRVFAGAIVILHLRPFLVDAIDGRIYRDAFYEPYAAWYPEAPRAVYVGLLWLAAVAAVAMSLGISHAARDGDHVRDRHLQPVPLHHALPQQPRVPRDRARGARRGALRAGAVAGRLATTPSRAGRRWTSTAPAWPLWLLRFECAAIYAASGTSKLLDPDWFGGTVTWLRLTQAQGGPRRRAAAGVGDLDPDQPRLPDRCRQARHLHRALHRRRAVVARNPLRGGLGRRRLPPEHPGARRRSRSSPCSASRCS